ncbi:hypothetical protein F511_25509 [Dorcoceras hygrometricum]|uniref:Uncharacterized protein n=1 Tax=Dorcoceras hygrometricum TaxID=472368 RepID=A0A2Z7C459_9LAMI|nr:hypothetical protein F511_25509 [Dorcoceras hygrometricum]
MSSPDINLVSRLAESIDRSSPPKASHRGDEIPSSTEAHRARILRIDQDEARLAAQGCTWYEIKASTLTESDISYIKDKAGITSLYESLVWLGEAASRFSKAHEEVIKTKRSMDGVLGRHDALMKRLEEIQTKESVEKESLSTELESARAEVQTLRAQMQIMETQVQSLEARAKCSEEDSKLHLAKVEKLQEERANSWSLEKEKFLKSKEFDSLCSKRASIFFDKGFDGCLAQFRATGYSEDEHPAYFLNVEQALADMSDYEDIEGSMLGIDLYAYPLYMCND